MTDSKKYIEVHPLDWLVIGDHGTHPYIVAAFLAECSARYYCEKFRNACLSAGMEEYVVCHRSELNDKYKVHERSAVNM